MSAASGAMCASDAVNSRARAARSLPTLMSGTICHSSSSAASNAAREYVMPPHSSTVEMPRPWIVSQTKVPITPRRFMIPSSERSALLFERRDGADHSRTSFELTRHDAARGDGGAEGAPLHFGAQRLEEALAGLRHAAGDHDDVGVQDVQQVRDAGAEETRGVAHDLERERIALVRTLVPVSYT